MKMMISDMLLIQSRMMMPLLWALFALIAKAYSTDTNDVYDPCTDSKTQRFDGFSFGLAISDKESFFLDQVQLSPCDSRLSLSTKNAQLAVFRPKVDEISLLTVNCSNFDPAKAGGYMVAFAGRKYAARSFPVMVAQNGMIATSFTLVLEFNVGVLQNMHWKKYGCESCPEGSDCMGGESCGVPTSKCKYNGGDRDCDIGIQVAFSGTDKNFEALNSWYEVSNIRRYSLYGLYSNLRDSVVGGMDS